MTALAESISLAGALGRLVERAEHRARLEGRPIIVSKTLYAPAPSDPVALFSLAGSRFDWRAYWEKPVDGELLIAIGAARIVRSDGASRFSRTAAELREDRRSAIIERPDGAPGGPVHFAGFAFDAERIADGTWADFPDGLVVLPRLLVAVDRGVASRTVNVVVEPDADCAALVAAALRDLAMLDEARVAGAAAPRPVRLRTAVEVPDAETWKARVADSVAELRRGDLDKVVLARALRLEAESALEPEAALRSLRGAGPAATVFAFAQGNACFIGLTPERLVKLEDGEVSVDCVAGSIARGRDADEEERLARALLASVKDRAEHEVVVNSVREALAVVCEHVERARDTPKVVVSRNVQHLSTPLSGRLSGGRCILDLVERLHPTPAVGGVPRGDALDAIREREGFDRGWYAGPVGWIDEEGEGEFVVAIRSALLDGRRATLFAGAGIMSDSTPESEYEETGLKLKPMLSALGLE